MGSIVVENMIETRHMWYEHVEKRHISYVVRIINQMERSHITRDISRPTKTIRQLLRRI